MRQFQKVGWLGHVGISILLLSSILPYFLNAQSRYPFINLNLLVIVISQYIGIVIYGIAILKAKVLPKEVGYLLLLTIPITLIMGIGLNVFSIIIGLILLVKKNLDEAISLLSPTQDPA